MDPIFILLFKGACASFSIFMLFWFISLVIKNPSIIDVCWGMAFIFICYVLIVNGAGWTLRNGIVFATVSFWGLRISYFVLKRLDFGRKEDHRYVKIKKEWKSYIQFNFLAFFLIQAFIEIFISLPFLFIAMNTTHTINIIDIIGILLCVGATIGESIADDQLEKFRRQPQNKGKVCQNGLWNYSRHPNYFFEFLIWVGFFVVALGSPYGWLAIISPLIVLHLVLNVSGIAFAEKLSLERRGEAYKEYQQTTSKFVPLPKRKI